MLDNALAGRGPPGDLKPKLASRDRDGLGDDAIDPEQGGGPALRGPPQDFAIRLLASVKRQDRVMWND